jgi:hypothetical protein
VSVHFRACIRTGRTTDVGTVSVPTDTGPPSDAEDGATDRRAD